MPRGTEFVCGQVVLEPGVKIGPAQIGLLASVGQIEPVVYRRPVVSIFATGDEIVDARTRPKGAQIRSCNNYLLAASVESAGGKAVNRGIVPDRLDAIEDAIELSLEECDMLIISGGVSAGKADVVPDALRRRNVEEVFHRVKVKPGKPVWFGLRGGKPVFGLPGNPVSVLVAFTLFVAPAIRLLGGVSDPLPQTVRAALARDHTVKTDRLTYWPSRVWQSDGRTYVEPLEWKGSADLRTAACANSLAIFEPQRTTYREGEWVEVLPL